MPDDAMDLNDEGVRVAGDLIHRAVNVSGHDCTPGCRITADSLAQIVIEAYWPFYLRAVPMNKEGVEAAAKARHNSYCPWCPDSPCNGSGWMPDVASVEPILRAYLRAVPESDELVRLRAEMQRAIDLLGDCECQGCLNDQACDVGEAAEVLIAALSPDEAAGDE